MPGSNEWPPEKKNSDETERDSSVGRKRRGKGGAEETLTDTEDALVRQLAGNMNAEAHKYSMARDKRDTERAYAKTRERHEREAVEHAEKLEAAKGRLKKGAQDRARLSELRQQISELNRVGSTRDIDAQVARLEQEIYSLENARVGIKPTDPEAEPVQNEAPIESVAYEGNPQYPVPMIMTPKEGREALKQVVEQIADVPKPSSAPAERSDLKEKEAAYLTAYKELEKRRTFLGKIFNGKELKEKEREVDALRHAYDQSRVTYAEALKGTVQSTEMSDSYRSRKTKEFETLKKEGSLPEGMTLETYLEKESAERKDKMGRYLAFREVIRPNAEKKLAARQEALDARGRNVFEKALGWSVKRNQELEAKYGKTGARAVRAATSALLLSVGAAGLGAAGVIAPMGLAALAGYGTFKFARSLGGALLGATAGEAAAHGYEALWGRRKLKEAQSKHRVEGKDSEITLESLKRLDRSREHLAKEASEMTLIKRKQLIRALTALGVGAGSAAALAEFTAVQEAAESIANTQPPVFSMEGALQDVTIGKGEGFNTLFGDIRASGFIGSTPVGQLLMNKDFTLTELSDRVNAFDPETEKSILTFEGNRMVVDAKENVWFIREGEPPRLVLENDPTAPGGVRVHELSGYLMKGSAPEAAIAAPGVPETDSPSVEAPVETSVQEVSEQPQVASNTTEITPEAPSEPGPNEPAPEQSATPEITDATQEPAAAETGPNIFGDPYMNANGVRIDPSEPHVYENSSGTFMSGGTKEVVYEEAQEFALKNNVSVFVDASYVDVLGNTVSRAVGFTPDGQGGIALMPTSEPQFQVRPETYTRLVR